MLQIVKVCLKTALSDNSGAFEQQSRLSYCGICADTCFRLRGDNLNENPPFYRAYGRPKAEAPNSWGDMKQETTKF